MSKDNEQLETTFYRFYSEIRAFLSKLISEPIKAEPSKYLKDRHFGKTKTIDILLDKGILERKESIKDQTDSEDYKKPTYIVQYKVKKKNFETKIHRIYSKYFEKNLPEKEKTDEIDECTSCASAGGANGMEYTVPLFGKPLKQNALYESKKKKKNIYVTQRQFDYIQDTINDVNQGDIECGCDCGLEEATTTTNIGALGDYTANGLVLKTSDGKRDPSYDR